MSSISSYGMIFLRHDQNEKYFGHFEDANVGVYAPLWVKGGLEILAKEFDNEIFNIYNHHQPDDVIESIKLARDKFGLKDLQKVARNEEQNVTGQYKPIMYGNLESKYDVVIALKDLARQSIVVGPEEATHFGGYPDRKSRTEQPQTRVTICDLAALQFQQFHNTGRFVLIQKHPATKAMLDEYIFENVVGEPKRNYEDAEEYIKNDTEGRYIVTKCFSRYNCFFDIFAYRRFVASDLILSALAVVHVAARNGDVVNFKFLKYGTGFFAGDLTEVINKYILSGVVTGLEELFEKYGGIVKGIIKHVELPFYEVDEESLVKIEKIREKHGLEYSFSTDDALKQTKDDLVTSTTNCGDSSVVLGNQMNFASVDATIAENLKRKGNTFSSILNKSMKEYFVNKDGTIVECNNCKN